MAVATINSTWCSLAHVGCLAMNDAWCTEDKRKAKTRIAKKRIAKTRIAKTRIAKKM